MWNIKALELTVQKLLARLKFQRGGQNYRITEWQNYRMTELQNDRITEWQNDRMTEWQNDRMTELQNDRITEWQNDRQDKNNMPPPIFDLGGIKIP